MTDDGFVPRPEGRKPGSGGCRENWPYPGSRAARLIATADNGQSIVVRSVSGSMNGRLRKHGYRIRTTCRDGQMYAWAETIAPGPTEKP